MMPLRPETAHELMALVALLDRLRREKIRRLGGPAHAFPEEVLEQFMPFEGVGDDGVTIMTVPDKFEMGQWDDIDLVDDPDEGMWVGKGKEFHNRDAQIEGAQLMQLDFHMNQEYLKLCRKHVKHYLTRANKYARESTLSKRVADWTERLKPVLRKEQKRPKFNIKKYSKKIITRVDQIGRPAARPTQSGEEALPEVNFAHVMNGAPKWEVCRAFLTTLFLTNQGNFDIETVEEDDGFKTFNVHLLKGDLSKVDFKDEQANQN